MPSYTDRRLLDAEVAGYLDGAKRDPRNAKALDERPTLLLRNPNCRTWIATRSGGRFYFNDPLSSDIEIEDIASGLSMEPRFNGQTLKPYSVAEHSVRASFLSPPEHALQALLHDASEAYMKDVATPLKLLLDCYRPLEAEAQEAIYRRFRLPLEHSPAVKEVDARLVATEARLLYKAIDPGWEPWLTGHKPIDDMVFDEIGWNWVEARELFLLRFKELWTVHSKTVPSVSYKPRSFWLVDRGHIHWYSTLSGEEN